MYTHLGVDCWKDKCNEYGLKEHSCGGFFTAVNEVPQNLNHMSAKRITHSLFVNLEQFIL